VAKGKRLETRLFFFSLRPKGSVRARSSNQSKELIVVGELLILKDFEGLPVVYVVGVSPQVQPETTNVRHELATLTSQSSKVNEIQLGHCNSDVVK